MQTRPNIQESESGPACSSPRRRVLIVDNSPDLAQALVGVIDLEGDLESVGCVSTGAEALALAQRKSVDAVVLDLGLEDCSGFALLDRLRQEHPNIKVVIFSGHASAELADQAKSRGAVACVRKGEDLGTLLGAIRAA